MKTEGQVEASKKINKLVKQAYDIISQAQEIADHYQVSFRFDLAYGMGGYYDPTAKDDLNSDSDNGWISSSSQC